MNPIAEHDYEPVPGLPASLPEGEYLLWQGRPQARDLAFSALHLRKLAIYFAVLIALRIVFQWQEGVLLADNLRAAMALAALALLALALVGSLAWLLARASRYTVTNRRVVIRCGITVPVTVNLPFVRIVSADLRLRSNGHGDIPLKLEPDTRASWIMLWPHVRPWQWGSVQPMLRAVPDARQVAETLASALGEANAAATVSEESPRVQRKAAMSRWPETSPGRSHGVHA